MTLHLPPGEVRERLQDNVKMYRESRRPSETTKALAEHWEGCLRAFEDYQAGRIALADLPYDVKTMGWTMPAWGTYGT